MNRLTFTLAALLGLCLTTPVNAAIINTDTCNEGDVAYRSLHGSLVEATACYGEIETNSEFWDYNNDSTSGGDPLLSELNSGYIFDYENTQGEWTLEGEWAFGGKDDGGYEPGSPTDYGFDIERIGDTFGTWRTQFANIDKPFAISLKGANGFGVYLFENPDDFAQTGIWNTTGLLTNSGDGGNAPGISHASLYVLNKENPRDVPENNLVTALLFIGSLTCIAQLNKLR